MSRFNSLIRLMVVILVINLLLVGAYFWFFHLIKAKNERISLLLGETETANQKELVLGSIKAAMEETSADRQKLDALFVSRDGTVEFIEFIERLASKLGIKAAIHNVGLTELPEKIYDDLHIFLEVKGSSSQVLSFLSLVENMPYQNSFEEVGIERISAGDAKTTPEWKGAFKFKVLKLK